MHDPAVLPVFNAGRIINWVILALMAGSIVYSLYIVVVNWKAITV
jgi:hypothetical protein